MSSLFSSKLLAVRNITLDSVPQSAYFQGFNQKLHISIISNTIQKCMHIVKDYTTEGCIAQGITVHFNGLPETLKPFK